LKTTSGERRTLKLVFGPCFCIFRSTIYIQFPHISRTV